MLLINKFMKSGELNIGKLLVLKGNHQLKISYIKNVTFSKKVEELKWTQAEGLDQFISMLILMGLNWSGKEFNSNIKIFKIEGDDAVSAKLRLATDDVLASVSFDENNIKTLCNAISIIDAINHTKEFLIASKECHKASSKLLTKHKKSNSLKKKNKAFDELIESYGDAEINDAVATIEDVMKSSW